MSEVFIHCLGYPCASTFSWSEYAAWGGEGRGESGPGQLAALWPSGLHLQGKLPFLRALLLGHLLASLTLGFWAETLLWSLRAVRGCLEGKAGQAAWGRGEDPVTRKPQCTVPVSSG